MSNIFDFMTEELSVTGFPERIDIIWDDPDYIVIREGYPNLRVASIKNNNEVEFNDIGVSVLHLDEEQKAEVARRLEKYKDRIVKMHLKHESLWVPVRRLNNGNQV